MFQFHPRSRADRDAIAREHLDPRFQIGRVTDLDQRESCGHEAFALLQHPQNPSAHRCGDHQGFVGTWGQTGGTSAQQHRPRLGEFELRDLARKFRRPFFLGRGRGPHLRAVDLLPRRRPARKQPLLPREIIALHLRTRAGPGTLRLGLGDGRFTRADSRFGLGETAGVEQIRAA